MLSEEVRIRLAQLNRHHSAPPPGNGTAPRPIRPTLRRAAPRPSASLPGCEQSQPSGKHWVIRQTLDQVWRDGPDWVRRGQAPLGRRSRRDPLPPDGEVQAFCDRFPKHTAFVDLETCGFAGSMIFLVGLLHWSEPGLIMSQLLARNYAEEQPVLESLWRLAAGCRVLVTFNGKSFDWPQLVDRSALHRMVPGLPGGPLPPGDLVHYDLLHHARRRWRAELPNCKLQTLERHICGRHRRGDIPGMEIPAAYHRFVQTGESTEIRTILHHNALDLVTLLQLSLRIAADPE
jgi:uncharacterized protein YprB with RNaseH-like and TPR domain